ncbi:DUF1272 domain-containing protein [Microbulbifer hainanensis]|uniref:DUF1272 domain-containing protein n=1 Tax=Microbulbifer hainanensis TaxID=2735675 RepID=UPI001866EFC5|nr:DUF1272 domain-containing protein [Microbulbifer hainanensis]
MLKMKPTCERCSAPLALADEAYICSFECTYCPQCAEQLARSCPNCQGQLVMRPTRTRSPTEVPSHRFKAKLEKLLS